MNLIATSSEVLSTIIREDYSTLVLLPKIEKLINKEEPTLEDVLGLCSHNQSLLDKLTRRGRFNKDGEDFAKEILFKKGLSFLKSLAIRTMNQEIFQLPLGVPGINEIILKKRSVILARFIKHYSDLLNLSADDAYLCGLFFNFGHVSFGKLVQAQFITGGSFDDYRKDCAKWTADALTDIGFEHVITSFIEDSVQDLFSSSFPLGQALARIGNGLLINVEESSSSSFRGGTIIDRDLLDATGLTTREIVNVLKELTRDYKGGTNSQ
jgi:hypothetical protein